MSSAQASAPTKKQADVTTYSILLSIHSKERQNKHKIKRGLILRLGELR
jgi:hypothetical protein